MDTDVILRHKKIVGVGGNLALQFGNLIIFFFAIIIPLLVFFASQQDPSTVESLDTTAGIVLILITIVLGLVFRILGNRIKSFDQKSEIYSGILIFLSGIVTLWSLYVGSSPGLILLIVLILLIRGHVSMVKLKKLEPNWRSVPVN